MFNVALFEPEIPPNTGNVIRLCANAGVQLHLIEPLGFELEDKRLRRAGLDYREWAEVRQHSAINALWEQVSFDRAFACSTKGRVHYSDIAYEQGDTLLFGPETRGLPDTVLAQFPPERVVRIPMLPHSRSLNLSNAVAVFVYEAWRQLNFAGAQG